MAQTPPWEGEGGEEFRRVGAGVGGRKGEEQQRGGGVSYFFLLNRLKRFSLSLSRLPGLDSAVAEATVAGSVWARAEGAGVLWLLGVTSDLSPESAAEMAAIQPFISSCKRRRNGGEIVRKRRG